MTGISATGRLQDGLRFHIVNDACLRRQWDGCRVKLREQGEAGQPVENSDQNPKVRTNQES